MDTVRRTRLRDHGRRPCRAGRSAALQRRPQVKAAIWFNCDKQHEGKANWRIDVSPESLRAFNETFAAPRRRGE